jgi:signal transduction histidine kinase
VFSIGLCVATAGLVWFSYLATREWQRGTNLLQERRAAEALALAHAALVRDMKGAWAGFLVPIDNPALDQEPPYDLRHRTAQMFAKFPYVESVVIWKGDGSSPRTYVFSPSDRQPMWDHSLHPEDPFPVTMIQDVPAIESALDVARQSTSATGPFAVYETTIVSIPYQIIAHLFFQPMLPHGLIRIVALTINLDWVRKHYFKPLLDQIARIGGDDTSIVLSVTDDRGAVVAASGAPKPAFGDAHRRFPFVFLEPTVLRAAGSSPLPVREFAVHVGRSASAPMQAAFAGARGILVLIAVTAVASIVALLQTARAVRGSVRLASMKSEFVSAVTHELKTPLAAIRLVGDTLAGGRYSSPGSVQEYARMLSSEATRLSSSIDQLLTYARYTDESTADLGDRPSVDVADLVDDALDRFALRIQELSVCVSVNVPRELPRVQVDPRTAVQVLEILIDNAIKYSDDRRELSITAYADGSWVTVTVADNGIGIEPDDLPHVRERFFRGRNVRAGGSGLGLAIADRIMKGHRSRLTIRSTPGEGTQVGLRFPIGV